MLCRASHDMKDWARPLWSLVFSLVVSLVVFTVLRAAILFVSMVSLVTMLVAAMCGVGATLMLRLAGRMTRRRG